MKHPNICVLYDIGHQDGKDYLVMEYLEGETLREQIARAGTLPVRQGWQPPEEAQGQLLLPAIAVIWEYMNGHN